MAASYSLTGRGLTPVSGGTDPLVVTVTGGNSSQLNFAAVACEVVASGASGSFVYAWTLKDPTNTDRTVLLDDDTIDSPTFTPDLAGGGGNWIATCVVTSGGQTVTVTKTVTVGQKGSSGTTWVRVANIVSDGTTDASVSGGNIVWGGVTFAAPNTGISVVDGDLVFANLIGLVDLARSAAGTRTAPLVSVSLSTLTGLSALGDRQVLVIVDVESFVPAAPNEAIRVGLEQASAALGSGGTGRGVAGGHAFSTTIRAASGLYQDSSGTGATDSTATTATIAGIGCLFGSGGVRTYSATTAYTDAAAVLADTGEQIGGMRPSATMPTLDQFVMAVTRPTAGPGATATLRGLQVWVR